MHTSFGPDNNWQSQTISSSPNLTTLDSELFRRVGSAVEGTTWDIEITFKMDNATDQALRSFPYLALNQPDQMIGHSVIASGLVDLQRDLVSSIGLIRHVRWSFPSVWIEAASASAVIGASGCTGVARVSPLRWKEDGTICEHAPDNERTPGPAREPDADFILRRLGLPQVERANNTHHQDSRSRE